MKSKFYLFLLFSITSLGAFSQNRVEDAKSFHLQKYEVDKIVGSGKGDLIEIKVSENEKFTAIVNMSVLNTDIITIGAQIQEKNKTFITLSKYQVGETVIYAGDIISHEAKEAYTIYTDSKNGEVYIKPINKDELIIED